MSSTVIQYPITVDGVTTRVLECGQGPAVLMIHGLSTRADRWRSVLPLMAAQGYRAIAFDLPGHGLADKRADFDYTSQGMARYAFGLLDRLDVHRVHLHGTSLGGHIAALMALEQPGRVASLYLTAPLGLAPVAPDAAEAIRTGVRNTSIDGVRAKFKNVFVDQAFATEALITEESRINSSTGSIEALSALGDYIVKSLNQDLVLEALAPLSAGMPVGLLWGEHDRMVPLAVGEEAARAFEGTRLEVMARVGHAPYVEKPGEFVALWQAVASRA